jgi:hypothetical protein
MPLPDIRIPFTSIGTSDIDEDDISIFPNLTFKERIGGFLSCMVLGFLISVSSFGAFSDLLMGYPVRFAVLYSMGNLTSLCSTMFLVGPRQQFKNMSHHKRRLSAVIYVGCMVCTPAVAYVWPNMTLVIVGLVATQWLALIWYTLSYIPYGRRVAANLANRLIG